MNKNNIEKGDIGEREVVNLVPCPNCGKRLQTLPKHYPMYDVQCTACYFRAQIKSRNMKPQNTMTGAGWDILHKVLRAGHTVPPLITNWKWMEGSRKHQYIVFYPFVPRKNIEHYKLSPTAVTANSKRFNYIGLNNLPSLTLYAKPKR